MRVSGAASVFLILVGVALVHSQRYGGPYRYTYGTGRLENSGTEIRAQKYKSLFPVVVVPDRSKRQDYGGSVPSLDPYPGYGIPGYTSGSPVGYSSFARQLQNTRYEVLEAKRPPKEENLSRYVVLKEYNVPPRVLSSVATVGYGPPVAYGAPGSTSAPEPAPEATEAQTEAPPAAAAEEASSSAGTDSSSSSTDSGSTSSEATPTAEPSLGEIQKSLNLIVRYLESQYIAGLEKDAGSAGKSMEGITMSLDAPAMSATDSYAASAQMTGGGSGPYPASGQPADPPKDTYGVPAMMMPPGLLDLILDIKKAVVSTAVKAGRAGLGIAGTKGKFLTKTVGNKYEAVVESVGHVKSIFT